MRSSVAETKMGRPKIEGLVSINLRLLEADLAALDAIVTEEQGARGDPAFNRTDLLREIVRQAIQERQKKRSRR